MSTELTWTVAGTILGGVAIALGMVMIAQNWYLRKLSGMSRPICMYPEAKKPTSEGDIGARHRCVGESKCQEPQALASAIGPKI